MGSNFALNILRYPQLLAALILAAFSVQAGWLVQMELSGAQTMESEEAFRIGEGVKQWHGSGIAGAPITEQADNSVVNFFRDEKNGFDTEHSPFLSLATAAPLMVWPHALSTDSALYWRWLARIPFLACGAFLGASIWYVARRLCGNFGGLIALTLYGFSPWLVQSAAAWHTDPEIVGAWGAFGTIFTAIAVAHTLYAPREVVLWNWRRIVLLGVSLSIAIGAQFSFIVLLPLALFFLLYVAPVRRQAALAIWTAATMLAFLLFLTFYFFRMPAFLDSMRNAGFWACTWRGFTIFGVYRQVAVQIGRACPALAILLPVTLVTYLVWPRTRYFGNTAPLLVAVLFIMLAIANPHSAGAGFLLAAIPFLFLFVSGVIADLLETPYRPVILGSVLALLGTYIARTLLALAAVPRG